MFKFRPNWKAIARHTWSVRLMIIATFFSGLEVLLPFLDFLPIPIGVCATISFFVTIIAVWARFVAQKGFE